MKRTLLLFLYLLGGILLGTLLGELAGKVSFLRWLCIGKTIGVDSFSVDLAVLQFSVSFHIGLNIAMLLCIAAAIVLYVKTASKVH